MQVAAPDYLPIPAFLCPGHQRAEEGSERNPQHWNGSHACRPKKLAEEIIPFADRGAKNELIHTAPKVAVGGSSHKCGSHQQANERHDHVILLDYKRCILVDAAHTAANGDLLRADSTENEQGVDQEENPEHRRAEPLPPFKRNEFIHRVGVLDEGM